MLTYIPFDLDDEWSCYSNLLIHSPWPIGGENNLLLGCETAVLRLREIMRANDLPLYVNPMLSRELTCHNLRNNIDHAKVTETLDEEDEQLQHVYNVVDENGDISSANDIDDDHFERRPQHLFEDGVQVMSNTAEAQ